MKIYKSLLALVAALLIPLFLSSCFGSDSDDKKTVEQIDEATVNQLFDSMMVQLERMYNAEDMDAITSENFSKMATDFKTVINSDPTNMKAGVGYIVSSMANLNSNAKLKEIADSLDVYFKALDEYWGDDDMNEGSSSTLFSSAYRKGGIEGLGVALLAKSPELMRENNTMPSFPKIVTMGKIQALVESEVIPVLDGVIGVLEGLESKSDNEMVLTFEEESYEIDMGEIYLADASLRLLRHTLLFLTAYNMDVKTPDGQDIHAVVDKFMKLDEEGEYSDRYIYSLSTSGETLFVDDCSYNTNDADFYSYMYDLVEHNMKSGSNFMKLQRSNHAKMYADIKMVPTKIKAAIAFIKTETDTGDGQENDLLKIADIDDMSDEMAELASDMQLDGLSQSFTDNFKSPTDLADFVSEILAGPYTFNETINDVSFNYTIDFSAFYTKPVQDFKTWLPLYKMSGKENSTYIDSSEYEWSGFGSTSFYLNNADDSVAIDASLIASNSGSMVTLKNPFAVQVRRRINTEFMPFHLIDNAGNTIATTYDEIEEALFDETLFPHFADYTFNGIFPDMTRAKWYQLFQDLDASFEDDENGDTIDGGTN